MTPQKHFFAIMLALFLAFLVNFIDLRFFTQCYDDRLSQEFTPYWPGLNKLETHEIFNPAYKNTKKIVFLGASNVETLGCDQTWSNSRYQGDDKNGHQSCSLPGQLQDIISKRHPGWRVFNLAKSNANVLNSIDIYLKIMNLRPEIVILGVDGYIFSANALETPQENLERNPLELTLDKLSMSMTTDIKQPQPNHGMSQEYCRQQRVNIYDFVRDIMLTFRRNNKIDSFKRIPTIFGWKYPEEKMKTTNLSKLAADKGVNPLFLQVLPPLNQVVTQHNGVLVTYQPYCYVRNYFRDEWKVLFESKLEETVLSNNILYFNMIDYPLVPRVEVYDNTHTTLYGNMKVAQYIYSYLKNTNLIR